MNDAMVVLEMSKWHDLVMSGNTCEDMTWSVVKSWNIYDSWLGLGRLVCSWKYWPLNTWSVKHSHLREIVGNSSVRAIGSSGVSQTVQALKGDIDMLLKGVGDRNVTKEVKHILEMARRASLKRKVLHTDFLTPPVLRESIQVLEKLADGKAIAEGGYPQAERCRISVGHPEELTSDPDIISALRNCQGDILGDIILQGEQVAQILVVPELTFLCQHWLSKTPLISFDYEPPRTKSFKTKEASVRVDALARAGFKISRSKLVDLIRLAISNLYSRRNKLHKEREEFNEELPTFPV
ncbi:hypothetical protein VNO77_01450 [Canavalia gladiata]|uniref:Uncharacterized protein n=1 Tax=Canavalia gladiata TaxID=3824 RepID=A0AAN9MR89_CANGL